MRKIDIFRKRPLFTACMLFLFFSVIGYLVSPAIKTILGIIALIVAVIAVIVFIFKKCNKYTTVFIFLSTVFIAVSLLISYFNFDVRAKSFEKYYGDSYTIEALVVSERFHSGNFAGYTIKVNRIDDNYIDHYGVITCTYDSILEPGMVFTAKVRAEDFTDDLGGYDQKLSMASDGIFIQYYSDDENEVAILEENVLHPSIVFSSLNMSLSRSLFKGLDKETAAMGSAMLLGNKGLLPDETVRDFTRSGASHILALSGMHMSIIMGVLMIVLKRLRINPKVIAAFLIAGSLFYLFLTGTSISAARSVIMLLIVYLGILSGREADSLTSLGIAGVVLMIIFPGSVIDAGFWMSFAATLGIITYANVSDNYFSELLKPLKKYRLLHSIIRSILSCLVVSIFAIIPMVVILCVFIKQISLMTVVTSFVLALPSAGVILFSLMFLAFPWIPGVSFVIGKLLYFCSHFMIGFCRSISDIENVVFSLNYPIMDIMVLFIALAVAYSLISRSGKILKSLIPFLVCIVLSITYFIAFDAVDSERIKVSYINASSQADMLVLTGGKDAVICDIGTGSKSSYNALLGTLDQARVTEIKAIMLTRCTRAHNASLYYMFTNEKVRELWLPYPENESEYYKMIPLAEMAERYGVDVYVYNEGEDLSLFKFTDVNVYKYYIKRSVVPITVVSIETRNEQFTFCSAAHNELGGEELIQVNETLSVSEYIVFGNSGPRRKSEYSLPDDNDAEIVIFSDEKSIAYYNFNEMKNITYALVEKKCGIYMEE